MQTVFLGMGTTIIFFFIYLICMMVGMTTSKEFHTLISKTLLIKFPLIGFGILIVVIPSILLFFGLVGTLVKYLGY